MWRSSPNSISGSFTASTNVMSPANAASIWPGTPPLAPPVKLVASSVNAPATANSSVQPIGTSTIAISAWLQTLAR